MKKIMAMTYANNSVTRSFFLYKEFRETTYEVHEIKKQSLIKQKQI